MVFYRRRPVTAERSPHKMKLGTSQKTDTSKVTQFLRDDVHLLWSDDWYDGPLSGMAEVNGERYRFELIDRGILGSEDRCANTG